MNRDALRQIVAEAKSTLPAIDLSDYPELQAQLSAALESLEELRQCLEIDTEDING